MVILKTILKKNICHHYGKNNLWEGRHSSVNEMRQMFMNVILFPVFCPTKNLHIFLHFVFKNLAVDTSKYVKG